MTLAATITGNN